MYHIELHKNGFISQVGGDMVRLTEALAQVKALIRCGAKELEMFEGCNWEGFSYLVCDEFGSPIRVIALGDKEE